MEVNLQELIVVHGEKDINNMQVGQLRWLHIEPLRNQRKEPMLDNLASSGNLGIKSNPQKNTKEPGGEERKKGRKPHKQFLEEANTLLIDSGHVVGLPDMYFLPQTKS